MQRTRLFFEDLDVQSFPTLEDLGVEADTSTALTGVHCDGSLTTLQRCLCAAVPISDPC